MSAPGAPHGLDQQEELGGQPLVYGSIPENYYVKRGSGATTHLLSGDTGLNDFAPASTAPASGSGSPEGVVTRSPGATYLDTAADSLWIKKTGTGNTGWIQLIA